MEDYLKMLIQNIGDKIDDQKESLTKDIDRMEQEMREFQKTVNEYLKKIEDNVNDQTKVITRINSFIDAEFKKHSDAIKALEKKVEGFHPQENEKTKTIEEQIKEQEMKKDHKLVSGFKQKLIDKSQDMVVYGIIALVVYLITLYFE